MKPKGKRLFIKKPAYVSVVGLGLGVWKKSDFTKTIFH
jgi:hypothetical protein